MKYLKSIIILLALFLLGCQAPANSPAEVVTEEQESTTTPKPQPTSPPATPTNRPEPTPTAQASPTPAPLEEAVVQPSGKPLMVMFWSAY